MVMVTVLVTVQYRRYYQLLSITMLQVDRMFKKARTGKTVEPEVMPACIGAFASVDSTLCRQLRAASTVS